MEKVKKSLIKNYPILRLYKSDVEEIFNLFRKHLTPDVNSGHERFSHAAICLA